jgi:hypothetical protein
VRRTYTFGARFLDGFLIDRSVASETVWTTAHPRRILSKLPFSARWMRKRLGIIARRDERGGRASGRSASGGMWSQTCPFFWPICTVLARPYRTRRFRKPPLPLKTLGLTRTMYKMCAESGADQGDSECVDREFSEFACCRVVQFCRTPITHDVWGRGEAFCKFGAYRNFRFFLYNTNLLFSPPRPHTAHFYPWWLAYSAIHSASGRSYQPAPKP